MIGREHRAARDLMRTRLRLVEKAASCKNSIARLLEKFNVRPVHELDELYRLQAACHDAQIALVQEQIRTLVALEIARIVYQVFKAGNNFNGRTNRRHAPHSAP